ncbi:hypothetical protein Ahu01nite_093840 [Winogradskya humida]|uniref:Uncharacterized protein n=1 Tax=Winogradskya humida TaxID=113566 RepID=A0ABQ4A5Z9_9ACTN|nr:hypothetical protein Ahu01nite_093840 [Actinoplanes humidus]
MLDRVEFAVGGAREAERIRPAGRASLVVMDPRIASAAASVVWIPLVAKAGLAKPGPARPGPARPGPARPGPARPGPARRGATTWCRRSAFAVGQSVTGALMRPEAFFWWMTA